MGVRLFSTRAMLLELVVLATILWILLPVKECVLVLMCQIPMLQNMKNENCSGDWTTRQPTWPPEFLDRVLTTPIPAPVP